MPVPATRGLLSESISRQLRTDILSGGLPPGTKLPSERALSLQFEVSRTIVRDVLRRLEAQQLIEIAPGRGSYVAQRPLIDARSYDALCRTSRPTVRQMLDARALIEVQTVALAAQRATDAEVDAIRAAHEAVPRASDVAGRAQADADFHDAIAAAAGNPVLRIMLASVRGMVFEVMQRSPAPAGDTEAGVPQHPEIVAAIEARDVDLARRCMHEHLAAAGRRWGAEIDLGVDVMASRHIEGMLQQPYPEG